MPDSSDRTLSRISDTYSFRRAYSSLLTLGQDLISKLFECSQAFSSIMVMQSQQSLAVEKRVTSQEIYFSPSISPGPLLVLFVSSVLFVF